MKKPHQILILSFTLRRTGLESHFQRSIFKVNFICFNFYYKYLYKNDKESKTIQIENVIKEDKEREQSLNEKL